YELGQCYRQVGDIAIVREHISKAASALHAAGDRRHLALVHSLSSISLAQLGRHDEAMGALRQAERLASLVQADDVLATVCGNQANVTMLQHHYEQALALAERSVSLHEAHGTGHGLAVAKADDILQAGAPPFDALQATLIAAEALTGARRLPEAEQRLTIAADMLDPKAAPATWGEYLRLRGALHAQGGSATDAYHDFA